MITPATQLNGGADDKAEIATSHLLVHVTLLSSWELPVPVAQGSSTVVNIKLSAPALPTSTTFRLPAVATLLRTTTQLRVPHFDYPESKSSAHVMERFRHLLGGGGMGGLGGPAPGQVSSLETNVVTLITRRRLLL